MLVEFDVEFKINLHLWFPGVAERPWNENYSEDELHRRRRNRRSSQKFWLACKTDDVSHNPSLRTISQSDCCPYKRSGQRAVDRCGTDRVDRCMPPKRRLIRTRSAYSSPDCAPQRAPHWQQAALIGTVSARRRGNSVLILAQKVLLVHGVDNNGAWLVI
jgi:hypothetical protein